MSRILAILPVLSLATALSIAPLAADEPEQPALREEVRRLLDKLASDDRLTRASAERELLQHGPPVLPWLPAPEILADVSVREAVRRIRIELERRLARESVEASTITLDGRMTVADALHEIARQTGNVVEVAPKVMGKQVDVSCQQTAFWDCLDRLVREAGLDYGFQSDRDTLTVVPADDHRPLAVAYSGPVRMALDSVHRRANLVDEANDLLRLRLSLAVEPRLRPLFLQFAMQDLALTTEDGTRLPPFNPQASYELPMGTRGRLTTLNLDYLVPHRQPLARIQLTGILNVLTAAGTEQISFEKLAEARGVSRRRGGVTVRVQEVHWESDELGSARATIGVAVVYDAGGPAFESHRTWIFHNAVWLQTADGERIPPADLKTSLQTDGGVAVEYRFENLTGNPKDYAFVYEAPTLLINVPVHIRFESIRP